jgi:hypothetical protein
MDAERDRGDQKQHRHHHEDQREGDLDARTLPFQPLVLGGGALRLLAVAPDQPVRAPEELPANAAPDTLRTAALR